MNKLVIMSLATATALAPAAALAQTRAAASSPAGVTWQRQAPQVMAPAPAPRMQRRDGAHAAPVVHAPSVAPHRAGPAPAHRTSVRHDGGGVHRGRINGYPQYKRVVRGSVLPHYWWGPRYNLMNWSMYGLPQPMHGSRWVRYYDDALLVDGHGRVHDGRWDMKWDEYQDNWGYDDRGIPAYVGNGDYRPDGRDYAWAEEQEGRYAERYGHPGGGYWQGGYGHPCGCTWTSGGMITVTETTTTPTVVYETVYVEEEARARPQRRWTPQPRRARPAPRISPPRPGERG